ncbi:MAG TPA: TonB-dependent receptor [Vicinamibacteria bacterium]|nr:TonB-dependent receptor [Vicinamibacteria bacterium]
MRLRPPLGAFVLLLLPVPAAAQGGLTGVVRTAEGTPVPQLVLTIEGPGGPRVTVTGPEGSFQLPGLRPGRYTVRLDAPGFRLSPPAGAEVGDGDVRLELTLSPAPVREHVLVSATRGEAALSTVGVSATVIDGERLAERGASTLVSLLQEVPGLAVARAGGVGPQASVFVRGGDSNATRVLVDGVPVNEPGGEYNFGPEIPLELERVEVVRGAASSLYGTDALAGVVHMVTRRAPPGPAAVHAEVEGGRFDWLRAQAGAAFRSGRFEWTAGGQRLQTDNQEPNSSFTQNAAAASGGYASGTTTARLVLRGDQTEHGTPGQTAFGRPDLDASFERRAAVAAAHLQHTRGRLTHHLRGGYARMDWASLNPRDSGPYTPRWEDRVAPFEFFDFPDALGFQHDTSRLSAGYQLEAAAGSRHLVTGGVDVEREAGALGSRSEPLLLPRRTNAGLYAQDRVVVGSRLFATVGGRVEHNASFGTSVVPRAALAFRARSGGAPTTLRASAGTGVKEPSFFESFGVSFFARGNPGLRPERSRTFDLGVEQRLFADRLRAEATAFHHEYRDQIAYHVADPATFQGSWTNLGRTRARGLELSAEASPTSALRLAAHYTLLDGEVAESGDAFDNPVYATGRPLVRRPRHQGALSARWRGGRATLGADLVLVGARGDSDFLGLGLEENDGYARLDARARVGLSRGLEALVVGENLLDRRYQEVLGYPALGRSLRVGVRYRRDPRP